MKLTLLKTSLLALVLLVSVTSCQKDELDTNETAAFVVDLTLADENDAAFAAEVLSLINDHRVSVGEERLIMGSQYGSALSMEHTNWMIENSEVNHTNFDYRSAALESNGAITVGENIAYGFTTAESVVNAWLNSTSHRDNIEGYYTHASFGIKRCATTNTFYFTQLFYRQ